MTPLVLAIALAAPLGVTYAAPEAGAPAPAGTIETGDAEAIRTAFSQLADSDAEVREAARMSLMGLQRRFLPTLQSVVEQSRPLRPSQAVVLRQIVTHVYLAGEPYDADPSFGFLGVRMVSTPVSLKLETETDDALELMPLPPMGVVIVERLPGFVGYRVLRDGDVILAIAERRGLQLRDQQAFSLAVRATPAGRTIHFHVLRRGRVMRIPLMLDPRPEAAEQMANPAAMFALESRRREKAETYWRESFGRLLRENLG